MKTHVKVYFEHFGIEKGDFIACEICGASAVDIHHLSPKKMGGSKTKDFIENLIALCRRHHEDCHDSKEFNEQAKEIHLKNL